MERVTSAGLDVRVFERADHTFNPVEVRGELMDWIVESIAGAKPPNETERTMEAGAG